MGHRLGASRGKCPEASLPEAVCAAAAGVRRKRPTLQSAVGRTTMAEPLAAAPRSQRPTMQSTSPERQREAAGLAWHAADRGERRSEDGPSPPSPAPPALAAGRGRLETPLRARAGGRPDAAGAAGQLTLRPLLALWPAFCRRLGASERTDSPRAVRRSARGRSAPPGPEGRRAPGAGQTLLWGCGRDILQPREEQGPGALERSRDPRRDAHLQGTRTRSEATRERLCGAKG